MRENIQLEVSEKGIPLARVPGEVAWDLVEYLSNQRVQVSYTFEASRVVVVFTRLDVHTAAELLDMWVRAEQRDTSVRGDGAPRQRPEKALAPAHV